MIMEEMYVFLGTIIIGILFFILALTSDYIKSKKTYNRER